MALLRRRRVFAAKIETVAGTAESIAAGDGAFNARDFEIAPNIAFDRHEGQGGFNYVLSTPGAMQGTATITHNLQWGGTTLPSWATVLLPACGYVNTAGKFSPVSRAPGAGVTLPKTLTIANYSDGKIRRLVGAMGNVVFTFPTGGTPYATFTFTGKYSENEADGAMLSPTYPADPNLRFASGKLAWDGVNICTSTADVDAGNSVVMLECANGDRAGYSHAIISNRATVITADPEQVLVATQNRDQQWLEMEEGPLVIEVPAPGGGKIIFTASAAQIENRQPGNRNDILTDQMTWLATQASTPDNEFTIEFDEGA